MRVGEKRTNQNKQKSGANRARWLAELDAALKDARLLVLELSRHSDGEPSFTTETATETATEAAAEVAAVAGRLDQAIGEVDSLRRGQRFSIRKQFDPN